MQARQAPRPKVDGLPVCTGDYTQSFPLRREKAMPEKTPAEREAIALGMWGNLGRVMAETFLMDRLLKDPSRFEFGESVD